MTKKIAIDNTFENGDRVIFYTGIDPNECKKLNVKRLEVFTARLWEKNRFSAQPAKLSTTD